MMCGEHFSNLAFVTLIGKLPQRHDKPFEYLFLLHLEFDV